MRNIYKIQKFEIVVLKNIFNTHNINNIDICDFMIQIVEAEIKCFVQKHEAKLYNLINLQATQLLNHSRIQGKSKKKSRRKVVKVHFVSVILWQNPNISNLS